MFEDKFCTAIKTRFKANQYFFSPPENGDVYEMNTKNMATDRQATDD
jgi:hypothetical protein